jgi:hypothetical protein
MLFAFKLRPFLQDLKLTKERFPYALDLGENFACVILAGTLSGDSVPARLIVSNSLLYRNYHVGYFDDTIKSVASAKRTSVDLAQEIQGYVDTVILHIATCETLGKSVSITHLEQRLKQYPNIENLPTPIRDSSIGFVKAEIENTVREFQKNDLEDGRSLINKISKRIEAISASKFYIKGSFEARDTFNWYMATVLPLFREVREIDPNEIIYVKVIYDDFVDKEYILGRTDSTGEGYRDYVRANGTFTNGHWSNTWDAAKFNSAEEAIAFAQQRGLKVLPGIHRLRGR